ncbi:hypothetical protein V3481_009047 [Fusarium oxysporum f. sp. vasinfectum]
MMSATPSVTRSRISVSHRFVMRSLKHLVENEKNLIKEAAKIIKKISNAFLTALNEINPDHASNGSITVASSADSEEDENDQNDDATIVQKAQNTTNRALRTFRKLNPTLSERKITIGFCIRQFRTMAPPKLLGDEQPMPHSKIGSVTMAGTRKTRRASLSRKDSEHNLHLRAQTLLYQIPLVMASNTTFRGPCTFLF